LPLGRRHRERHHQAEGGGQRAERAEVAFDDLEADVGEAGERRQRAAGEDDGRGFRPARALGEVDGQGRIGGEADRDQRVLGVRAAVAALHAACGANLQVDPKETSFRDATFANECFIDELAASAEADPIEFRLRHLDDERGIEVIKRTAALAGWDTRHSPKTERDDDVLTGRGFAYCKYEMVRTYVGAVAEVELTRSTGDIRVKKVFVGHDCGRIVNPDGLKNQIDGSTIQTVSRVLKQEVGSA
jgi:CO/xanthine dehydrogenase Mo-binding subunit